MSEKLHHHERQQSHEHVDIEKEVRENFERIEKSAEHASEHASEQKTEQLRSEAEKEAVSGKEYTPGGSESTHQAHSFAAHAQLKEDAYRRLLQNTRQHLTKRERTLSSILHRPGVEKASEIASKTIARPVGVTYGALSAALGVSIALMFAYRYGFSFNYALFIFLFMGGYLAATVVELTLKLLRRKKL